MAVTDRITAVPEQVRGLTEVAREQLHDAREQVSEQAHEALSTVGELRARAGADPRVRRSRIAVWELVRAAVDAVIAVLRFIPRMLSSVAMAAQQASERGEQLSERAREVVAAVPPSRAERWRSRRRTGLAALLGFLAGVVAGLVVAARRRAPLAFEDPAEVATDLDAHRTQVLAEDAADDAEALLDTVAADGHRNGDGARR